ncbi:MAG TPA: DUF6629 family protein [Acidimicrobiales bacterium]|nr:DUF6629 family protein [Acidimicrobiales bacterium]
MCFSPEGDLAVGIVVTALGVDACRHVRGRNEYWFIAPLPVLLGLHQIVETFVWWGLEGHVPHTLGVVALWIYLLFALVVLPVLVPVMVMRIEPTRARRWWIAPFLALGALVSVILLTAMLSGNPTARIGSYHIAYSIGLKDGTLVIGLYIVATCGAMLASGIRRVVWFGLANLVAVVVLARLSADGFTSLWCFYAALASAAIALHLRLTKPDPGARETSDARPPGSGGPLDVVPPPFGHSSQSST